MNSSVMKRAAGAAAIMASVAALAMVGPVGHASAATPQCGWTPANNRNMNMGFNADGVNIRSGPSTACTVRGVGYTSHAVTFRCVWWNADEGRYWDYLTDRSTGITGWAADEYTTQTVFSPTC